MIDIDIRRRFFLFGAVATLVVPAPKSFFIVSPPKLILSRPDHPFELSMQQMLDLLDKLDENALAVSDVPRWLAVDARWYDEVTRSGWVPVPRSRLVIDLKPA